MALSQIPSKFAEFYPDYEAPHGGFDFSLTKRNTLLEKKGLVQSFKKTGTTIAGVVFDGGVVLGADTRATAGEIVVEKNCKKIHYMAPNMYCCGAGTAADTENTTALVSSQLEIHRRATGRENRVITAVSLLKDMLYKYQGHIGAYLILGGVDVTGPSLWSIHAAGSLDCVPYLTLGSGSLAAMAIFEANYKPRMNEEDAKRMVFDAISAGIMNDLGSGSNVDLCVIKRGQTEYLRGYSYLQSRKYQRPTPYSFPRGTTAVLSSKFTPLSSVDVTEGTDENMEV
eukprot:TRINITY_DN1136_c0_g1_i1.p1 TRINITY_DN1136_c0_g1~~TRINITY_DN1136_c0_g1_i1.p1  ORF type:complete len:284 (-),score=79.08 TRINITY_DN1136_c0_g1_i1:176-1027(-)